MFGLVFKQGKGNIKVVFFNENDPIKRNIADAGERRELLEQYSSVEEGMGFSTADVKVRKTSPLLKE